MEQQETDRVAWMVSPQQTHHVVLYGPPFISAGMLRWAVSPKPPWNYSLSARKGFKSLTSVRNPTLSLTPSRLFCNIPTDVLFFCSTYHLSIRSLVKFLANISFMFQDHSEIYNYGQKLYLKIYFNLLLNSIIKSNKSYDHHCFV